MSCFIVLVCAFRHLSLNKLPSMKKQCICHSIHPTVQPASDIGEADKKLPWGQQQTHDSSGGWLGWPVAEIKQIRKMATWPAAKSAHFRRLAMWPPAEMKELRKMATWPVAKTMIQSKLAA